MNEYYGGCHCGAVSFKFQSQEKVEIWKCNCSICNAYDYEHLFIKHEDLTLINGDKPNFFLYFRNKKCQASFL